MPPTNYIWMRTNMRNELIGVYEWLDGKWRKIEFDWDDRDVYTKAEVDLLISLTESEIIRKIAIGEYSIGDLFIDEELSLESENAVQNKVVTAALDKKLDKQEFYDSAIPDRNFPWN